MTTSHWKWNYFIFISIQDVAHFINAVKRDDESTSAVQQIQASWVNISDVYNITEFEITARRYTFYDVTSNSIEYENGGRKLLEKTKPPLILIKISERYFELWYIIVAWFSKTY